jgi:hypothetical protein
VEDYMGGKERHGSLKTYEIESSKEREIPPTHHKESSVYDEAYKGDLSKLIDKAYKENMLKLVMRYNTATQRPGCSLKDTVNLAQQIDAMMKHPLGVDADGMIDEKEEVPEEEPTEGHDDQDQDKLLKDVTEVPAPSQKAMEERNLVKDHKTREEGEIAPLDALYPTMRVSSDGEKQQTHQRMSAMHKSTYQEDVKTETYQEDRSCAKNVVMQALHHPRDRQTYTTIPALMTMTGTMWGPSLRQGTGGPNEDQDDPLRHGGGGGA